MIHPAGTAKRILLRRGDVEGTTAPVRECWIQGSAGNLVHFRRMCARRTAGCCPRCRRRTEALHWGQSCGKVGKPDTMDKWTGG